MILESAIDMMFTMFYPLRLLVGIMMNKQPIYIPIKHPCHFICDYCTKLTLKFIPSANGTHMEHYCKLYKFHALTIPEMQALIKEEFNLIKGSEKS